VCLYYTLRTTGKTSTTNGKAGKGKGKNTNIEKENREKAKKRSAAIALAEVAPQEGLYSYPLEARNTRSVRNVPASIGKWEKSNAYWKEKDHAASAQLQAKIEEHQKLKEEYKQLRKKMRSMKYRLKDIAANAPGKGGLNKVASLRVLKKAKQTKLGSYTASMRSVNASREVQRSHTQETGRWSARTFASKVSHHAHTEHGTPQNAQEAKIQRTAETSSGRR